MTTPTGPARTAPGLNAFNALDRAAAERALLQCCSSTDWAQHLAAGRPYADPEQLFSAADAAVAELGPAGLDQALAGHPRIGERLVGPGHETSAREQAGMAVAGQQVQDAIAAGNAEYERRFGHVYLVCATGRSAAELLEILRCRLDNDPDTEDAVTRAELTEINRIRLVRMLAVPDRSLRAPQPGPAAPQPGPAGSQRRPPAAPTSLTDMPG